MGSDTILAPSHFLNQCWLLKADNSYNKFQLNNSSIFAHFQGTKCNWNCHMGFLKQNLWVSISEKYISPGALGFEMEKNIRKLKFSGKYQEVVLSQKSKSPQKSPLWLFLNSRWPPAPYWNNWKVRFLCIHMCNTSIHSNFGVRNSFLTVI